MSFHLKPLDKQTIVITGASSGIGLATARAAAQRGARIMLAARDGEALQSIVADIAETGGQAAFHVADVSSEDDVQALAAVTTETFGGFDTWVNNAGIGLISTVDATSPKDHHRLFEVNYFGLVYGSVEAVRHFRESGKPGALINLGSAVSDMPMALSVAYSATKHAIKGFTDGLRTEILQDDLPISVTLIKPSAIDTRFFDHAKTNMGGMGKAPGPNYAPSVVADAILYAAEHKKRDIAVGSTSALGGRAAAFAPGFIDAQQKHMSYDQLIDYGHMPSEENLYDVPEEGHERSRFPKGRAFSASTTVQTNKGLGAGLLLGIAATAAILALTAR